MERAVLAAGGGGGSAGPGGAAASGGAEAEGPEVAADGKGARGDEVAGAESAPQRAIAAYVEDVRALHGLHRARRRRRGRRRLRNGRRLHRGFGERRQDSTPSAAWIVDLGRRTRWRFLGFAFCRICEEISKWQSPHSDTAQKRLST